MRGCVEVCAFDLETYVDIKTKRLVPYCLAFNEKNQIKHFYGDDCVEKFVQTLANKSKTVYYAHNLTFDGAFIIDELTKKNIKFEAFLVRTDIYNIKLCDLNDVSFKCSFKLFPTSLKIAVETLFCGNKLNFNHKAACSESLRDAAFKKNAIKYCINDVRLVMNILKVFKKCFAEEYSAWSKKYSISAIALGMFTKKYNNCNIETKLPRDTDSLLRASYFGGRCEIFGNLKEGEQLYHFDFKGMYSQAMLEDFPIGEMSCCTPTDLKTPGFYQVRVRSDMQIPVLPYRDLESGKLIFANGEFSGLYWYEELNYFIKKGGELIKISWACTFTNKAKVFKKFSQSMVKKRLENPAKSAIFKLVNNSLYGRLGMSANDEETIILLKDQFYNFERCHTVLKYAKINEQFVVTYKTITKDETSVSSNVIYASIITAKARIKLHKGFCDVENNGGRLLYTDTDSIFAAFTRNVDNEKHGEVFWDTKKNDTKPESAVFARPKTYAVRYKDKDVIKMKGVQQPEISYEVFSEKFYNHKSELFNEQQLFNNNFIYTERAVAKLISLDPNEYAKRKFTEDLTETKALIINDEATR